MTESDASESSVNLVDLSAQIDAELTDEGGSIFQAEGSLSVRMYRHEPYRPDSDEEAVDNEHPAEDKQF